MLQQQITDSVPHAHVSVFSRRHIPRDIQIVLNSTPVGMFPKENLAPLHYLPHKTEYVFDAIYNPPVTATMRLANPRKTKTKQYRTDEEYLQMLADRHPVIGLILEYRGLRKLLSTYVEALPQLVNPRTGRIHTSFNQAVTATGRLSSPYFLEEQDLK